MVLALVFLGLLVSNLSQPAVNRSDSSKAAAKASRGGHGGRPRSISTHGTLASGSPTTSATTQLSLLGPTAASYLASRQGTATAAVYDIATGQTWHFHREVSRIQPAS